MSGDVAEASAVPAEGAEIPSNDNAHAEGAEGAETAEQIADENPQKRGETDKEYELRLSKLTAANNNLTREVRNARKNAEKYADELKAARAELERGKGRKGVTRRSFLALNEAIKAAKDEAELDALFDPDDDARIPPAIAKEIAELKREAEERKARESQQNEQAYYKHQVGIVSNVVSELVASGDCPLFDGYKNAAAALYSIWHQEWQKAGGTTESRPDIYELAAKFHNQVASDLATALQSEKARSFLFARKPELKALVGGQEARPSSPTSEHQGAVGRNSPPAKASTPTVQRKQEPPKKRDRYDEDEARLQASREAYREHQLRVRSGKA